MNCEEIEKRMLEAEAQETLDEVVCQHLVVCASCRTAWRDYEEVIASLREMPAWEPPGDFAERIIARLSLEQAFRRQLLFASLLVSLVTLGGWWFYSPLENFMTSVLQGASGVASFWEIRAYGMETISGMQLLGLPLWQFGGWIAAMVVAWFATEAYEPAPPMQTRG